MSFLNRAGEVALLEQRLASDRAELLVVYGRRRIGKTELLAHMAAGTRSVHFEATASVAMDQLRDLSAELGRVWGNKLLTTQPLTSWEAALTAVGQFAEGQRTLVVIDEFQLLAQQAPELETVLSRWWRTTGRRLPLVLILAGSELSFFEDRVLAGQLYGRRTGQLKLEPFLARDAALFHPNYSEADKVRAFSVCGGVPYYLDRFIDDRPLRDHLLAEVFLRTGLLHDEAELMLRQSIADPSSHIAVLRSIAHGHNRNNAIGQRTGLSPGHVTKLLDSLERLGLVRRVRPVTVSPRSKKTAYAIADHFLRFHYRFVDPAKSQLRTQVSAAAYVSEVVWPQLDHHASATWEDICRQHVLRDVEGVNVVGRWWGQVPTGEGRRTQTREIDIVGVGDDRRPVVVGMCKWTAQEVDFNELNLLDRLIPHIAGSTGEEHRYLFSRSGFTARLRRHSTDDRRLTLVRPADIYNG